MTEVLILSRTNLQRLLRSRIRTASLLVCLLAIVVAEKLGMITPWMSVGTLMLLSFLVCALQAALDRASGFQSGVLSCGVGRPVLWMGRFGTFGTAFLILCVLRTAFFYIL